MHSKYFENIVIYLSVLLGCIILGILARMFAISVGADEFTANIVFVAVTLFGVLVYGLLSIFIKDLFTLIKQRFFPKEKQVTEPIKKSNDSARIDKIRTKQKQLIADQENNNKAIAIQYTQTVFAPYTSDKDLVLLSRNITSYAEKKRISEIQSVEVTELNSIDLYHFGWNIWNHFRTGNQLQMAAFLKRVFPSILGNVETETIKRHLKDDEQRGIIQIRKNLSEE
ncbi:hypothetical protein SAMN05444285_11557 [Draconibacterium orientale]|uniref:Mobilization protein n=1 Tax=Draconibacterium orientale TaxID=1168034 RepID=X5DXG6_9BACT|nr:hypothetical protein [Draconibacterium orientale]AHW58966.1 mobilization protein [Draconibacterium orientale]SET52360.1 hypothetical protein SAMN05444285_11557 [Draconibacterium orientale]